MRIDWLIGKSPWIVAALAVVAMLEAGRADAAEGPSRRARATLSREYLDARALFEKTWLTGERSPAGGDGVGPLFNERSCVACHNQGGTGGSGGPSKDAILLTAIPGGSVLQDCQTVFKGELADLHPGFLNRSSIVLHQHARCIIEDARLASIAKFSVVQTRDEVFTLDQSRRSTPALFGAGRIDRISDAALLAAEARSFPAFPEIKGRVSRLRGGRLGRFGWKGQTASLDDFVLAACANEIGLEVRGHHQASLVPLKDFDPRAIKPDLTDADCDLLRRFVVDLPTPAVRPVGEAEWGLAVFESIGCATCHAPNLGGVPGIYSDLLLHDLGDRFRAFGGGYGAPTSSIVDKTPNPNDSGKASGEAGPNEWRTAPLWGVASSSPYLHDGRAPTLDEAIRLHAGEASKSARRYANLADADREALLDFLLSLVAPAQPGHPIERVPGYSTTRRKKARADEIRVATGCLF